MPSPKTKDRNERPPSRQEMLDAFNMIGLAELAQLWGVDVKTLQNKDPKDLPRHSKVGGKRLFFKEDVVAYMRKHMV